MCVGVTLQCGCGGVVSVCRHHQNHHRAMTNVSSKAGVTEMNGSDDLSNDRHGYKHFKNHVASSNGATTDASRLSHQTTVIYSGKQSSTVLATAFQLQQKSAVKNVGNSSVTSNGGLNGYHTTTATLQRNTNTHRTRYNP